MSTRTNRSPIVQVAVGIVVDKVSPDSNPPETSRILITRRKADQVLAGLWELPGGKLEPNESPADAVVRELHEEVGIDVMPIAELAGVEHRYDHAHVRLIPFICSHVAGEPQPLDVDEVRWVTPNQLTHYAFPEASLPVLDELVRWLDENP